MKKHFPLQNNGWWSNMEKIMNGLPNKDMARPGVHIAQSEPNIIYLMTEFEDGGTAFKSVDRLVLVGGEVSE